MSPEEAAKRFVEFAVRVNRLFRSGVGRGGEGLTEERFRTLLYLDGSDGTGLTELSERIGISPSSLCLMLKKLDAEGFVDRSRNEPDRRNVRYRTTADGSAALAAERRRRLGVFAADFGRLSESERDRFAAAVAEVDALLGVLDSRKG